MITRRRIDSEQARARLLALRDGHPPGTLMAQDDDEPVQPESLLDRFTELLPGQSSIRPVVAAIALTAVVMWIFTHMSSMAPASVVELSTGSPVPLVSGVTGPGSVTSGGVPTGVNTSATASLRTIIVQVLGEVHEPGLVTLPDGSRVADAIEAAGGLLSHHSSGGLNVARRLVDGEQIVVSHSDPTLNPQALPTADQVPGTPVSIDLNTADLAALDSLPGVGPVMAGRILAWRAQHGRFTTIDQLHEVSGVGQRTFERLRPFVHV